VDAILEDNRARSSAFEVKAAETVRRDDFRGLKLRQGASGTA
jgi:uncharacterized protein